MKAAIVQPGSLQMTLGEAPDPIPTATQVLIDVQAFSLNFGDVKMRSPGRIPGWDASGTISQATPSSPPVGTRVVTFGWGGAWAEKRAVEVSELAIVPDTVDLGMASALPVAGVTALRALRAAGDIANRRILITGASGGVGRLAVQLAHQMGAYVIAMVGRLDRGSGLAELGAHEVITNFDTLQPVYAVLDNVGGTIFDRVLDYLELDGKVIAIGVASGRRGTPETGKGHEVVPFQMGDGLAADLQYLVDRVAQGNLDPQIGWRSNWEQIQEASDALMQRQVLGKAVLDIRA
jgi:NADPH:quinone reductase-like Zn-dependent oxidoreductase